MTIKTPDTSVKFLICSYKEDISPTMAVFTSRFIQYYNFSVIQKRKTQELKVHVPSYVYIFYSNSDGKLRHDSHYKLDTIQPPEYERITHTPNIARRRYKS